jgi:hypothetical protein
LFALLLFKVLFVTRGYGYISYILTITAFELQQDRIEWKIPSSEPKSSWQAFPEATESLKSLSAANASKSVRSRNGQQNKQATQPTSNFDSWGFGTDTFSAARAGSGSTDAKTW